MVYLFADALWRDGSLVFPSTFQINQCPVFRKLCGNVISPPSVLLSDLELEISKCPGLERGWFDCFILFLGRD